MSTLKPGYSVEPYIFFPGKCEEAIEFYRKAVGAEVVMLMRYKDAPPCDPPPGSAPMQMPPNWSEKVMHARIKIGGSLILLSDACSEQQASEGFSLSLTVPNAPEAEKVFGALAKGGKIEMPLGKTFFSPAFGMLKDQFGVSWMVYVAPAA